MTYNGVQKQCRYKEYCTLGQRVKNVRKCPSTLSNLWSPTQKMLEIHYVFCFEEKMALLSPFEKGFWRFQKSHFLPTYKLEYFLWLRSIMLFITLCKTRKPIQFPIIQPGISILVVYLPNWIVFIIRRYSFHFRTEELFYIGTYLPTSC